MHSKLLEKNGLINKVAGSDYNFRYQKAGNKIVEDVDKLLTEMNIKPAEIYTGQQMHTDHVVVVDSENGEDFIYGKTFKETDGLITSRPNVALLIKYADCTPIVLFDPIKSVQAIVHSGWRGTTKKIALKAIDKMETGFGCKREDMLVYVGPSIDQENYEVGPEVYEAFEDFEKRDSFFKPNGEKYKMSMTDANVAILIEAGIKEENMEVERTSTYTDETLHSARQEGAEYQLNGLLTMIKS
ncbi:peptidoglycan editing factor PgeF [Alkalibacterium sp. f15]|uniref:peptidoglycan editing factor PgeF n=1 Tax=Alkalibacterium sp. f15 TaxID=3414029 RepID=UPI003BF836B9